MMADKVPSYAFPGGYPLFYYIESDDGRFHSCPSCVNQNRIGRNVDCCKAYINYEDDTLYCEVCEKQIESAYGEDE
jgi:hypothetical protein